MVQSRIGAAVGLVLLAATIAEAQLMPFTGAITGHLGAVASGDVRDWTVAPGASMAVLDSNGLGVELDVSHAGDFDTERFADSSITTVMLNVTMMYPHERVRPFLIAGAGILRVRAALPGEPSIGRTDSAWGAGGGILYMIGEAVGVRGDVRYFRNFVRQDTIPLGDNGVLDFVRASFGVTYTWQMR